MGIKVKREKVYLVSGDVLDHWEKQLEREERFAKRFIIGVLIVVALVGFGKLAFGQIPQNAAQYAFSVQNNPSPVIVQPCGASQKPIPTSPGTPFPAAAIQCIPNVNALGHSLTLAWTSPPSPGLCTLLLDGGNNINGPFSTLAASNSSFAAIPLNQTIGTGNGILLAFSGTLTSLPAIPLSVTVTAGAVSGTDNGSGVIAGAGISGTINYTSGAVSVTFTVAPAGAVPVVVTYTNGASVPSIYANGYYTFVRVKISACAGGSLTAVYSGYSQPLPVTVIADATFRSVAVASPVKVTNYGTGYPYVIKGFQLFNPNSTPVYVQFFKKNTTPTLGTNVMFEIGVPAGSGLMGTGGAAFTYTGPDIPVFNLCCTVGADNLWIGAATAAGGSSAAGAVVVDVETNGSGPFYPMTPVSP